MMMSIYRIRKAIQSGLQAILRALTARRPSGTPSRKEQILTLGLKISDGFNGQPQPLNHQRRPTGMDRAFLSRRRLTGERASRPSPSLRIYG